MEAIICMSMNICILIFFHSLSHIYIYIYIHAAAKSLQSCLTLCDPMDFSLPGFSIHGILQARTLEWVVISFSNAWKWKVKVKSLSCVWLLVTPWTAAHQAPPSMGFSVQPYWSGVPLPSPYIYIDICIYMYINISQPEAILCHSERLVMSRDILVWHSWVGVHWVWRYGTCW